MFSYATFQKKRTMNREEFELYWNMLPLRQVPSASPEEVAELDALITESRELLKKSQMERLRIENDLKEYMVVKRLLTDSRGSNVICARI